MKAIDYILIVILLEVWESYSFIISPVKALNPVKFYQQQFDPSAAPANLHAAVDLSDTKVEPDDVTEEMKLIPTINTKNFQISVLNPFGPSIKSLAEAKVELRDILTDHLHMDETFRHGRIEYLVKVLESRFIPIQTLPFLNLALEGEWNLKYSNVLTPHKDANLR
jgi:hypothetical protein